jgi:hypothetical protein
MVGILGFFGAQWWQRREGPQQVIVTNQDTTRRVVVVGDTTSQKYLAQVLKELQGLRRAQRSLDSAGGGGAQPQRPQPVNPVRVEGFSFPAGVHGYLGRDFSTWGRGTCPSPQVASAGELTFAATLRSAADTARLSPLYVSITRKQDAQSVATILDAWYDLRPQNRVVVPAPSEPGTYSLEYGVYALNQLTTEYPPLYRRACRFTVR